MQSDWSTVARPMFCCTGKHMVLDMAALCENQRTQNTCSYKHIKQFWLSVVGISTTPISLSTRGNMRGKTGLESWSPYNA